MRIILSDNERQALEALAFDSKKSWDILNPFFELGLLKTNPFTGLTFMTNVGKKIFSTLDPQPRYFEAWIVRSEKKRLNPKTRKTFEKYKNRTQLRR